MDDQRVETRSVLYPKYRGNCACIQRIPCQPVYRFGRNGDYLPRLKVFLCFLYIFTRMSHALTKVKDMTRFTLSVAFLVFVFSAAHGQREDSALKAKLESAIAGFGGDVGIYVEHIDRGTFVAINADTLFPTASMIKVPITIALFDKIESGAIAYDSILTYRDSLLYEGEDILGSFKDGERIALSKVMMLMITTSDNTASLWCQHLAGTGTAINAWLAENGFTSTRMNSRTPGRHDDWRKYGWGQTTPREMARLLLKIRNGEAVSPRASERIYRNLTNVYYDGRALSQIPPWVQVASKQGFVSQSRSEVALVNAPHGDYVFCIITKNQKDRTFTPDSEGYVLLRLVSRMLWDYFEPENDWKPAEGTDEWYH